MKKTLIFFLLLLSLAYSVDLHLWELFSDEVTHLAIHGSKMMKVGFDPSSGSGNHPIYSWSPSTQTWISDGPFLATQVALGSQNSYFRTVTNTVRSKIFPSTNWVSESWTARHIKIGTSDHVFYAGTTLALPSGFAIYKWNEGTTSSEVFTQGALVIAVDPAGNPWRVDPNNNIYRWDGSQWIGVAGKAIDIIIGSDYVPYILGQTIGDEGFIVQKWNTSVGGWDTLPGISGVSLALDSQNNPYVVTNLKQAFRLRGVMTEFCPGI